MSETSAITKVVTPEFLRRVRDRISGTDGRLPCIEVARQITAEFPEVKVITLSEYIQSVRSSSDFLFGLYEKGTIRYRVFLVLATATVDSATKDFLAKEFFTRNEKISWLLFVKRWLKDGCSVAEAIMRASGEIPDHQPKGEAPKPKSIDALLDEISKAGFHFRAKVSMAIDLLPAAAVDKGKVNFSIFEKSYMLRHALQEQLTFLDGKLEQYLKEMHAHEKTETELSVRRNGSGGQSEPSGTERTRGEGDGTDEVLLESHS